MGWRCGIRARTLTAALFALAAVSRAAVLPDDRADLLFHDWEGGGVTVEGPSILVRKKVTDSLSLAANYYVDMISSASVDVLSTASPAQGPRDANGETARLAGVVNQTSVSAGADLEMTGERGSSLGYDAMEVTFEVSSERRLNSPYVVTITRFHEKGSEPGMLRQLVYAKALDPIGNHPSAVRFLEGGFPLAFELKNFEVHLYNLGAEVATNVAPQREQLTRDEAFNYVKTRYIRAHQDATLPATPVMGRLDRKSVV